MNYDSAETTRKKIARINQAHGKALNGVTRTFSKRYARVMARCLHQNRWPSNRQCSDCGKAL